MGASAACCSIQVAGCTCHMSGTSILHWYQLAKAKSEEMCLPSIRHLFINPRDHDDDDDDDDADGKMHLTISLAIQM